MFLNIIIAILLAGATFLSGRRCLHTLQLESYQLPGYFKSLKRNPVRLVLPPVLPSLAAAVFWLLPVPKIIGGLAAAIISGILLFRFHREPEKKKFVVTERVKRLLAVHAGLALFLSLVLCLIKPVLCLVLPAFESLLVALSALCAEPIEKKINQQFVDDAKARLEKMPNLIKIGITGSYGKTSTKFILRDMLSIRYRVLATPGSFNTTMGVTRVIREQLMPSHQVFIAEMGARHVGDIQELCDLVHPSIGIITSVGPQHLDTFGTIDRIKNTKYELIQGLPEDGIAVFPADGAICEELYARCPLERKALAPGRLAMENVRFTSEGTHFELVDHETGEQISCVTKMLGEYALSDMLLCAQVVRMLGFSMQEVARGIALVKPVEHRLQLLKAEGGITIIDDAFNSNPRGAASALRVLARFPGRHIIVTPGMVELGDQEAELNRVFGEQMAEAVDIAVLVGKKHTLPIAEGMLQKGFPKNHIYTVGSFQESMKLLSGIFASGDVVLYENDLPDNYTEN